MTHRRATGTLAPGGPGQAGLAGDEVHVWRVGPAAGADLPALAASLVATLAADERLRAARFRFPPDRDRFVAARGALRQILGYYLGRAGAELRFAYGPRGKPALARRPGDPDLRFNLSHAADLALIAVTLGREVGIDLERLRPVPEAARIAADFFAPEEQAQLASAPAAARDATFLRLWTAREAIAKGHGWGLGEERPAMLPDAGSGSDGAAWEVRWLDPGAGYVASLAIAGGCRVLLRHWAGAAMPADG